jgi:hypothetical protein
VIQRSELFQDRRQRKVFRKVVGHALGREIAFEAQPLT